MKISREPHTHSTSVSLKEWQSAQCRRKAQSKISSLGHKRLGFAKPDITTCGHATDYSDGLLDNHGWEWRCYMRDPDGYLIEVGQYSQMALDRFKNAS